MAEFPSDKMVKKLIESGLLVSNSGNNTVRFTPPLIITNKDIDDALAIIKNVLQQY